MGAGGEGRGNGLGNRADADVWAGPTPQHPGGATVLDVVHVVSVVFSQGVNEMQTVANISGDTSLQEHIN